MEEQAINNILTNRAFEKTNHLYNRVDKVMETIRIYHNLGSEEV